MKNKTKKAEALLINGIEYAKKNNFETAVKNYNAALEIRPDFAEAFYERGYAHSVKRRFNKALKDYNRAITCKPDFTDAILSRGSLYATIGDLDKAISDLDLAIKQRPDYADAYLVRGQVYLDKGDSIKSNEDFAKAKELGLDDSACYSGGIKAEKAIKKNTIPHVSWEEVFEKMAKIYGTPYKQLVKTFENYTSVLSAILSIVRPKKIGEVAMIETPIGELYIKCLPSSDGKLIEDNQAYKQAKVNGLKNGLMFIPYDYLHEAANDGIVTDVNNGKTKPKERS